MSDHTVGTRGLVFNEPLIFDRSVPGRVAYSLPPSDVPEEKPERLIPRKFLRKEIAGFPEVSELDVVRHFTRLSQWNFGIDLGMYPLGSCTMKYNPRVNEDAARLPGFARAHPYQPEELSQGALQLMYELAEYLAQIAAMDAASLQPAAGAHGELTGMLLIRAYHVSKGNPRKKVLVPDSAHGTNPASSAICGYQVIPVKTGPRGSVEPQVVADVMDADVAAIMVTNPNTLGLFEEHIVGVCEVVHAKGGQVYCDGANMNPMVGIAKMGAMGIDVLQYNLHKTFSTPHGGGGPGSGPVAMRAHLAPFMPVPVVGKRGARYALDYDRPHSIGKVRAFYGNFGMMVRAYAYIRTLGPDGLRRMAQTAVINANYLMSQLKGSYDLPYDRFCKHECVFSDAIQAKKDVHTLDIAKRLMDYGFHPPTIYFPLIVKGALMIEPTESESKETLDEFIAALKRIAAEAEEHPDLLHEAPQKPRVSRLNEVKAAREPNLRWRPGPARPAGGRGPK